MSNISTSIEHRFWEKVHKTKSCWLWTGYKNRRGYGVIKKNKIPYNAHRLSWEIRFGKVSGDVKISQKCGNKLCVNPEHLQTGRACQNQTFEQIFLKYVKKSIGCWLWSGEIDKDGYGRMKLPKLKKKRLAHRVSWQIHKGEIPKMICVLHKCDVRNCVNPKHLFLGTNRDNSLDMVQKNRQAKGERVGTSILTDKEVLTIRSTF